MLAVRPTGLSSAVKNRQVVGETGVINAVSMLLRKELDIVGPLQLSSIGLLKHLTGTNSTFRSPPLVTLITDLASSPSSSPELARSTRYSSSPHFGSLRHLNPS